MIHANGPFDHAMSVVSLALAALPEAPLGRRDVRVDLFLIPRVDMNLRIGSLDAEVSHAADREVSDRYYLASWALAYYLATERNKLGSPELDQYVVVLKKPGADPVAAFEAFAGQPLPAFEKSYLSYLRKQH